MSETKITVRALAAEWGVSRNRVYQLLGSGVLRYIESGFVDKVHAYKFRKGQVAAHPTRTLFTAHGNGGSVSPPKINGVVAREKIARPEGYEPTDDELFALPDGEPTDDELFALPVEDEAEAFNVEIDKSSEYAAAMAHNNRTQYIKLQLLEETLKAKQQKREFDQGLYVLRADAFRAGLEAARVTGATMAALPDQIAGIFTNNPAQREEVRRKVQEYVERAQHVVAAKLEAFGKGDRDAV